MTERALHTSSSEMADDISAIHKSIEGESSFVKRIIYAASGGVNNKLNHDSNVLTRGVLARRGGGSSMACVLVGDWWIILA